MFKAQQELDRLEYNKGAAETAITAAEAAKTAAQTALNNAISARESLEASVATANNVTLSGHDANSNGVDDAVDTVLNQYKANYLKQDGNGVYVLNEDNPLFTKLVNKAERLKGILVALSIIYEAKRDMRGLVQQELDGESDALKGLPISKMFAKKTELMQQYIQKTIANLLQAIKDLNTANQSKEESDIIKKYKEQEANVKDPGLCDDPNSKSLEMTRIDLARTEDNKALKAKYLSAEQQTLAFAKNMLARTGMNISGNTSDEIWSSINVEINNALDSFNAMSRQTLSAEDDPAYLEMNRTLAVSMRERLTAAFGLRRVFLAAKQAVSDMRNLVHQEMTGIGGRQSDTEAAAAMNESESQQTLTWYDEAVNQTEEIIRLKDEIRWCELEIKKDKEMIKEYTSFWNVFRSFVSRVFNVISIAESIAATILRYIPGCQIVSTILTVASLATAWISGILSAGVKKDVAEKMAELEEKYKTQDIKPTDQVFEGKLNSVSGLTDAQKQAILANYSMDEGTFENRLNSIGGLSADQKNAIMNAYDGNHDVNWESFVNGINSMSELTDDQKQAIRNAYDSNAETFSKNLDSISGLSIEQKSAAINAYDGSRESFINRVDSMGGLTEPQKEAIKSAYDRNAETFSKNLDMISGLSAGQKSAAINAYDGSRESFINKVDSMTGLTEVQKEAIKKAYDRNAETFKKNLEKINSLTAEQKSAAINAYNGENAASVYSGDNVSDAILNLAANAESSMQNIQEDMTYQNYLTFMEDGHSGDGAYAGSSAFDTVRFASAMQAVNVENLKIMVANSARTTLAEMRNLVHMEMTSIGGRQPSNMVTYAMEAARAQQAFAMFERYYMIADMNASNNMRFQRDQRMRLYNQIKETAETAYSWSWVPIVGGTVSSAYSNLTDLYNQKDQLEETNNAVFDADARLSDEDLNALITNGLINTGNDTTGVDYQKIADVRTAKAGEFIKASVEASMMKVLRQMRSLAHQEMTNIQGSTGTDFTDQANLMNFQTAMQSLSLLTQYLSQKAQIQNRVVEANKQIEVVNKNIKAEKAGIWIAAIAALTVGSLLPGGFSSFLAAFNTVQLASSVANFILGVAQTFISWNNLRFAKNQAKDDMGDIANYLQIKETMDNSVNSTESRLEELEQKCIDEINAELIQGLGAGYIGVNRGLAAKYQSFMEQLYRAETKKTEVAQTLREMRNKIHEIMTGISGASSNAALSVLNIKEQDIKAKIDNMFSKLEVACERWNQISDAERAAKKAEIQAWMTTITTAIQGVIVAISLYSAFSQGVAAKNLKEAKQASDKALDAYNKALDGSTTQVKPDQAVMNKEVLSKRVELAQTAYNNTVDICNGLNFTVSSLSLSEIAVKLVFAYIEKAVMVEAQNARQGKVADKGVTNEAKDSKVMSQNVMIGDITDFAARQQASLGQMELDNEAANYALKSKEIQNDFEANMNGVVKDSVASANDILKFALDIAMPAKNAAQLYKETLSDAFNKQMESKEIKQLNLNQKQMKAIKEVAFDPDKATFESKLGKISSKILNKDQKEAIKQAYIVAEKEAEAKMPAAIKDAMAKNLSKKTAIPVNTPNSQTSPASKVADPASTVKPAASPAAVPAKLASATTAPQAAPTAEQRAAFIKLLGSKPELLRLSQEQKTAIINALVIDKKVFNANIDAVTVSAKLTQPQKNAVIKAQDAVMNMYNNEKPNAPQVTATVEQQPAAQAIRFSKVSTTTPTDQDVQVANIEKDLQTIRSNFEIMEQSNPANTALKDICDKTKAQIDKALAVNDKSAQLEKMKAALAVAAAALAELAAVSTPLAAPSNKQSANSSNVLARLDQLISNVGEMINEVNVMQQTEVSDSDTALKKPDIESLKELLVSLQKQLTAARKALAGEKANLVSMKKEVEKMQGAFAGIEKSVEKEKKELLKKIQEVADKIRKLKELVVQKPESKGLADKQITQMEGLFDKLTKSYEQINDNLKHIGSAGLSLNTTKQEKKVREGEEEISQLKQKMTEVQKAIGQLSHNNVKDAENGSSISAYSGPESLLPKNHFVNV